MDEQNTTEQQRRQRADLVDAFSRRAWQPTERPKVGPRILAGGAALIVVAGAALTVGALSHRHKQPTDDRARPAAMTSTGLPTLTPTLVTPTPTPTPKAKSPKGHPSASHRPVSHGARSSHGVRISGMRRVLIHNVMTGMCVDVPGNGNGQLNGEVEQYTCDGSSSDNQLWDLVVDKNMTGPRGATLFTIRNSKDGLCLDLPGSGTVQKAGVTEYKCLPGSGDNQMWYLERKASGRYWIHSYDSVGHQCLDVSGLHGSGGEEANLTIYPCSLQDDHLWTFS
jgi:hypothetical protein